jgi:hypothetical protein
MISRRTRARFSFLGAIVSLAQYLYQERSPEEDGESVSLAPWWLVVGGVFQLTYSWAYDHDFGAIRTNRWRRGLFGLGTFALGLVAFSRSPIVGHNVTMGSGIGRIGYRLWYGVLHPLPDPDK